MFKIRISLAFLTHSFINIPLEKFVLAWLHNRYFLGLIWKSMIQDSQDCWLNHWLNQYHLLSWLIEENPWYLTKITSLKDTECRLFPMYVYIYRYILPKTYRHSEGRLKLPQGHVYLKSSEIYFLRKISKINKE